MPSTERASALSPLEGAGTVQDERRQNMKTINLKTTIVGSRMQVLHCSCGKRTYGRGYSFKCKHCGERHDARYSYNSYDSVVKAANVFDNGDKVVLSLLVNTVGHRKLIDADTKNIDGLVFQNLNLRYIWNLETGQSYLLKPKVLDGEQSIIDPSLKFRTAIRNITYTGYYPLPLGEISEALDHVFAIANKYYRKKFGKEPEVRRRYFDVQSMSTHNKFPFMDKDTLSVLLHRRHGGRSNPFDILGRLPRDASLETIVSMYDPPRSIKKIIYSQEEPVFSLMGYTSLKKAVKQVDNQRTLMNSIHLPDDIGEWEVVKSLISLWGETTFTKKMSEVKYFWTYLRDVDRMLTFLLAIDKEYKIPSKGGLMKMHDKLSEDYDRARKKSYNIVYNDREAELEEELGGYDFVLPKETYDLTRCGRIMNICVGSYDQRVLEGLSTIVFVKTGNNYNACLEVQGKKLVQAKTHCNNYPEGELKSTIEEWCKAHKIRYQGCMDLTESVSF